MSRAGLCSRRAVLGALSAIAAAPLVGAGAARAATGELIWSVWESNGDPSYVKAFEAAQGAAIRQAYMTGNDAQFAALRTGAAFDAVTPSLSEMTQYVRSGLIQPLDTGRIPGMARLYDVFAAMDVTRDAGGATYGVPYLWGANPITYRRDKFDAEPGYATLFDSRYKGQLSMRDYPLEAVAIAGIFVGVPRDQLFSMDAAQLAEARKALLAQKPLLRSYWQSIGDLTNQFATGEITAAFSWRVPYDALKDKLPMAMARPAEGLFGWCDCIALPADLDPARVGIAHAFIDYLLGPDYATPAAMDGNYATTTDVIRDALTPEHRADLFIDDLTYMKSFIWPSKPDNYAEWIKIWAEVKAS